MYSEVFDMIARFTAVMDGAKMWRYRVTEKDDISDGSIVIARECYSADEWKQFGGHDGRGAWVSVKKYKYYVGVKEGDVVLSAKIASDGKHVPFLHGHDWFKLEIDEKAYDRAVKAKAKADAEAEKAKSREIERQKAEEERIRRMEEEAEKARIEKIRLEEERLAAPLVITVGMWEAMQKHISELESRLEDVASYVDMHDPLEE
ncbi:MAG: hypothetical protein [Wendovervirus sonii]|uniref:Uncharacterized protein n=1 Tax=phage Lak_Megaphage_Sonny TaxID=3109229 RepID=A0ABZ0Z5N5_9CAUD|nr:MAG: hypothetical protein [phage Lak_Megaphage_Sonny]